MSDDAVRDLVRRWAAAEESNDPAQLEPVLADGFVGVGAAGFVLDRAQWLARFGNGLRNDAFAVEEPQVHVHGDTAYVVGVDAQRTHWGDNDVSGRFRVTLTAVRGAGASWRVAGVHIGPLAAAGAR